MKTYIYFIFYVIICGACSKKNSEQLVLNFNLLGEAKVSEVIQEYSVIPLETTNDNLIVDVTVVKLTKNKIFILEPFSPSKSLHAFNIDGKYLGKVGGLGRASNEYIMPHYFVLDKKRNKIILMDIGTSKILTYDMTTFEFIKSYKVPFYSDCFEILDDDHLIWYVSSGLQNKGEFSKHIQITDMECNPVASFVDRIPNMGGLYNVSSFFAHDENKTYFHHPFMAEYYDCMLSENAFKQSTFSLNFAEHPFAMKKFISQHSDNIIERLQSAAYVDWCDIFMNSSRKLCYFGAGKEIYWGIYENNKGRYVNRHNLEDDLGIGRLSRPKGIYNDYFVSAIYMENVEELPENSILKPYVDSTHFGGNPLIILYK